MFDDVTADNQPLSGVNQSNQGLSGVKPVEQISAISPVISGEHKIDSVVRSEGKGKGVGFNSAARRFDWAKKRKFLRAAKRFWPNVTICCAAVGISDSTFYTHRNQDKIFAQKIAEIDRGVTDRIEGVLADQAVDPKSFLDRIAYLRAHRPELYNPAKVVKIEGYKMGPAEAKQRMTVIDTVVDAEIAQSYLDRKQIKSLTQGNTGEGGGGSPGGRGDGGDSGVKA